MGGGDCFSTLPFKCAVVVVVLCAGDSAAVYSDLGENEPITELQMTKLSFQKLWVDNVDHHKRVWCTDSSLLKVWSVTFTIYNMKTICIMILRLWQRSQLYILARW